MPARAGTAARPCAGASAGAAGTSALEVGVLAIRDALLLAAPDQPPQVLVDALPLRREIVERDDVGVGDARLPALREKRPHVRHRRVAVQEHVGVAHSGDVAFQRRQHGLKLRGAVGVELLRRQARGRTRCSRAACGCRRRARRGPRSRRAALRRPAARSGRPRRCDGCRRSLRTAPPGTRAPHRAHPARSAASSHPTPGRSAAASSRAATRATPCPPAPGRAHACRLVSTIARARRSNDLGEADDARHRVVPAADRLQRAHELRGPAAPGRARPARTSGCIAKKS